MPPANLFSEFGLISEFFTTSVGCLRRTYFQSLGLFSEFSTTCVGCLWRTYFGKFAYFLSSSLPVQAASGELILEIWTYFLSSHSCGATLTVPHRIVTLSYVGQNIVTSAVPVRLRYFGFTSSTSSHRFMVFGTADCLFVLYCLPCGPML